MTDLMYLGILILLMIVVFIGNTQIIKYIRDLPTAIVKHTKRVGKYIIVNRNGNPHKIPVDFEIDATGDYDVVSKALDLSSKKSSKIKTNKMDENKDIFDNVTGLIRFLEDSAYWTPMGMVDIVLTDEKSGGYSGYQHARISDDSSKHLYKKMPCDEIRGIDHYYVWQSVGYCEDDYYGYMLFPLKNGKYYKVSYSC